MSLAIFKLRLFVEIFAQCNVFLEQKRLLGARASKLLDRKDEQTNERTKMSVEFAAQSRKAI